MHIGKSVSIGFIKTGTKPKDLAEYLGISYIRAWNLTKLPHVNGRRQEELAAFFDVKVSEFISWSEED